MTQVLLAAVELGLPAALAGEAGSASELAEVTATKVSRLERLLRALAAAGIVAFADGRWALTAEGDAFVPAEHGEALDTYAEHLSSAAWPAWAGLAKTCTAARPYPIDELSDRAIAAASRGPHFADAVILRWPSLPEREPASPTQSAAASARLRRPLLERRPDLKLSLVELPWREARAEARLAQAGLGVQGIAVTPYQGQRQLDRPADRLPCSVRV